MKIASLAGTSESYDPSAVLAAVNVLPNEQLERRQLDLRLGAIDLPQSEPARYERPILLRSFGELAEFATSFNQGSNGAKGIEAMLAYALDRDFVNGISIGILINGKTYIRAAGRQVTPISRFEIGSLTKIYTAELLKSMVQAGLVDWNDPVTAYLSNGLKSSGRFVPDVASVTLLDLALHWSGLPGLPPNLKVLEGPNPFGHYNTAALERYLITHSLRKPSEARYAYSNLGYGVLGYALENATGQSFEELLRRYVLGPMQLEESELAITGRTLPAIVKGHTQGGRVTPQWTQQALAPAGALCSSVGDQLKFAQHLLAASEENLFAIYTDADERKTGLGWQVSAAGDLFERDSMTDGFCSYIGIKPKLRSAVVVLANRNAQRVIRAIARNLENTLEGLTVEPLDGEYGRFRAVLREAVRPRGSVERALRRVRLAVSSV